MSSKRDDSGSPSTDMNPENPKVLDEKPNVTIFLRPIAAPAALGLAGFASATFITASWIANWWGDASSPTIFFPFVALFGGLAQFIAGLMGYAARDTLVTVVNTMWGAFWLAIGLLYYMVAAGILPAHSIYTHFPELAAWFVTLAAITWSCAFASLARDWALAGVLFTLAIGSTVACSLFAFNDEGTRVGIKVAAYFFLLSSLLAWWRTTAYLIEEAYGANGTPSKFVPIGRTPREKSSLPLTTGIGEPGVKKGAPVPQ